MSIKLIAVNDIEMERTIYINPFQIVYIDTESNSYNEIFMSNGYSVKTDDNIEELDIQCV